MPMYSTELLSLAQIFLSLNKQQSRSFLAGISRGQCNLIRIASYNLLMNSSVQMSDVDRIYLRRHSAAIRKLASRRLCLSDKKDILVKKAPLIRRILQTMSSYITQEQNKLNNG